MILPANFAPIGKKQNPYIFPQKIGPGQPSGMETSMCSKLQPKTRNERTRKKQRLSTKDAPMKLCTAHPQGVSSTRLTHFFLALIASIIKHKKIKNQKLGYFVAATYWLCSVSNSYPHPQPNLRC